MPPSYDSIDDEPNDKKSDFDMLMKVKTRKERQLRVKFIMNKYNFKIKGYYKMNKNDVLFAVEDELFYKL